MNQYIVGTLVTMSSEFKVSAADTDPTAVTFELEEPNGKVTTYVYGVDYQLVKDSTGKYHVDWLTTRAGTHTYRFAGTTACQAANEGQFVVPESPFI